MYLIDITRNIEVYILNLWLNLCLSKFLLFQNVSITDMFSITTDSLKYYSSSQVWFEGLVTVINPFSTNVPLVDKPGSWFLLAKSLKKYLRKSDILNKYAGRWPASLLKMSLLHRWFSNILLLKTNYLVSI